MHNFALRTGTISTCALSTVERRVYVVERASVERVNSRLEFVGLECLKLRGMKNVLIHVLLCIIVLLVAVGG